MNSPVTKYLTFIGLSCVLSILLAVHAYLKRKQLLYAKAFMIMSLFSAVYIIGHAMEIISREQFDIFFWIKVQYLSIPMLGPLFLIISMQYAGLDRFLTRKFLFLLFAIPAGTVFFAWTNEWHHMMYMTTGIKTGGNTIFADFTAGPWYIIHSIYKVCCMVSSVAVLVSYWASTGARHWKQIVALIIGIVLPMTVSFLYLMGLSPNGVDPVPLTLCLTNSVYFWAIFGNKLFELAPLAKDRIFESMRDGVLVLDHEGKVIDFNKSAKAIFPILDCAIIGRMAHNVFPETNYSVIQMEASMEWTDNQLEKCYQVDPAPIYNRQKKIIGKTIVFRDITEQKAMENKLRRLAYMDGLTNIYNRGHFLELANVALAESKEKQTPFSVILFDIDHFKQINDRYGHPGGDAALLQVVDNCRQLLGEDILFGRYGGEEFVLCLPDVSLYEAGEVAEQLRQRLFTSQFETNQGLASLTASFGVSEQVAWTKSLDTLLYEADQALYASKENGRNAVHLVSGNKIIRFHNTETAFS